MKKCCREKYENTCNTYKKQTYHKRKNTKNTKKTNSKWWNCLFLLPRITVADKNTKILNILPKINMTMKKIQKKSGHNYET